MTQSLVSRAADRISEWLYGLWYPAGSVFTRAANRVRYWCMTPKEQADNDELQQFWDTMTPRKRLIWLQWGKKS